VLGGGRLLPRNAKGLLSRSVKQVENRWEPGRPRREMTEDWDGRQLSSLLRPVVSSGRAMLLVEQRTASGALSSTSYQLDGEDRDVLEITHRQGGAGASLLRAGAVVALRRLRRRKLRLFS
jgi:hypothetical protein